MDPRTNRITGEAVADLVGRLRNYNECHDDDVDEAANTLEGLVAERQSARKLFRKAVDAVTVMENALRGLQLDYPQLSDWVDHVLESARNNEKTTTTWIIED